MSVETVAVLAGLHALSESLETTMGTHVAELTADSLDYIRAWQPTVGATNRATQVAASLDVAERLDRYTRRIHLRKSMRLMRGPAQAAGLSELQRFPEAGFETLREMRSTQNFIAIVKEREYVHASVLFVAMPEYSNHPATTHALDNLPT